MLAWVLPAQRDYFQVRRMLLAWRGPPWVWLVLQEQMAKVPVMQVLWEPQVLQVRMGRVAVL